MLPKEKHPITGEPVLNKEELEALKIISEWIVEGLSCDINGEKFPCFGCRFRAIDSMMLYLAVHGIRQITNDYRLDNMYHFQPSKNNKMV